MKIPEQDKRYGDRLDAVMIDNGEKTYLISVIEHRGEMFLDLRSIYFKEEKPMYGKGVRIPLAMAEEVLIVTSAYIENYT